MQPPAHGPHRLPRRAFLGVVIATGTAPFLAMSQSANARMKAAVIGHTDRGNFGHDLDTVFNDVPNIDVVAVADPVDNGRAKAAERTRAARQYADYREMLEKERPQLVSVAPRWTDQRHAMVMAALNSGAHVITEKPFTRTLAEADEMLERARRSNLKIAVAHQMRLAPSIVHLKKLLDDGALGELLEMRAHGKQDSRAGGEDMIVLGTHLFDLMRLFAGDPVWVTARATQSGKEATLRDARQPSENIGPVLGDEIHAHFAFANGVNARFSSRAKSRQIAGPWGMELIGAKAVVRILANVSPDVYLLSRGEWKPDGNSDQWRRPEGDPMAGLSAEDRAFRAANRRVVNDWLKAIGQDREPACSGKAGMKAVEMCLGVFESALSGNRARFPLKNRRHPLEAQS